MVRVFILPIGIGSILHRQQLMFGMALAGDVPAVKPTESTPELAEESGEIADDFLESFI